MRHSPVTVFANDNVAYQAISARFGYSYKSETMKHTLNFYR